MAKKSVAQAGQSEKPAEQPRDPAQFERAAGRARCRQVVQISRGDAQDVVARLNKAAAEIVAAIAEPECQGEIILGALIELHTARVLVESEIARNTVTVPIKADPAVEEVVS